MEEQYYDALHECGVRYYNMLVIDPDHDKELLNFVVEFLVGIIYRTPLMKLNRWLGYIQANVIRNGYTTVTAERDWTRPLFRPLDFNETEEASERKGNES